MSDRGAAGTLQAELTKKLRQHIDGADAASADALRRDFAVLADDYRTLQLMDELPEHADAAYSAWRQLAPELTDAVSRQQLLGILAEAYAQAGRPPGAR
ncbi:MAG: hypothetical protein AAFY69_11055 [Pseudomonadota bacterium]